MDCAVAISYHNDEQTLSLQPYDVEDLAMPDDIAALTEIGAGCVGGVCSSQGVIYPSPYRRETSDPSGQFIQYSSLI